MKEKKKEALVQLSARVPVEIRTRLVSEAKLAEVTIGEYLAARLAVAPQRRRAKIEELIGRIGAVANSPASPDFLPEMHAALCALHDELLRPT